MNRQKTVELVKKLSGRELDAAVAERVMGHVIHVDNGEGFCENCGEEMLEWKQIRHRQQGGVEPVETRCVPEYSESIEAAMQVVEKLWQMGWQVEMVNCHKPETLITENACWWYVRFINNENDMNNWSAEADLLPEAICHAALAAVESSGDK
jgi:hypothetical protein